MKYNFGIIGAAGYIAPRHMEAIYRTNNNLSVIYDKFDSIGIVDRYFPEASMFTEFELLDRYIERNKDTKNSIDYISICSPNYLHDAHIRTCLKWGANAICEKPVVLNPWTLDSLVKLSEKSKLKINTILQLRLHPTIVKLKNKIGNSPKKIYDIELTYIAPRGKWYFTSWKGDVNKSGGVATNIGVHFFDMLIWIFGDVVKCKVHKHNHDRASGYLELKNANVKWFLSIDKDTLPKGIKTSFRSMKIDDKELEFSDGFEDLHLLSYKKILNGNGFSLNENIKTTDLISKIRNSKISHLKDDYHPLSKYPNKTHPFGYKVNI